MKEYFSNMEYKVALSIILGMILVIFQETKLGGTFLLIIFALFIYLDIKNFKKREKMFETVIIYDLIRDLRYFADPLSTNKNEFNDYELDFIKEKLGLINIRLNIGEKEIHLGANPKYYKEWIEENSYQNHTNENEKVSKIRKYQFNKVVDYLKEGNYRKALWELLDFVLKEKEKGLNDLEVVALIELNKLYLYYLENNDIETKNTAENLDTTVLKSQLEREKEKNN